MLRSPQLTRRGLVAGVVAMAGLAAVGCRQAQKPNSPQGTIKGNTTAAAAIRESMTVYRDPSCGCCEAWAAIARSAGFGVNVVDRPDMTAIKRQHGVPQALVSCHTALVGGYAIEGHVPLEDVQRLLNDRPRGIRGIAVAGMPLGSPGMEVPDGTKQPFRVMAFDGDQSVTVFSEQVT